VNRDIDESSENVLSDWSRRASEPDDEYEDEHEDEAPAWGRATASDQTEAEVVEVEAEAEAEAYAVPEREPEPEPEIEEQDETELPAGDGIEAIVVEPSLEHAAGDLEIPEGYAVLEGDADGGRRAVGVVVARFNGSVTSRLLDRALEELEAAGVRREAITVMVVPGAFELPLAATALAKTRRFACIVALGCVIRGDTPHFDYVASETASGLQLAALETGVPVSFGVLTLDRVEQADARVEKGAEAVRSALEMADVFSHLRAAASR
jgi:6,7-dimethyl-8-ribityllumazine synthase